MTEEMEKALKAIALHVRNELTKVEKELDGINEKLGTNLDDRIKKLEDKLATKGKVPSNVVDKIQELEGKVSSLYEKLEKKTAQETDIEKILDEKLSAKINEIQKPTAQLTDEKISALDSAEYANKIESLRNQFEGMHAEFEKRFSQLNTEAEKKFSVMSSSLEKRFEEKLKPEPAKGLVGRIEFIENELKNLQKTEKEVEEEGAILAAADKKIQDIDLLTKGIETKFQNVEKLERQIEKALDEKATKVFTKHLDDFSRVMDRRFPSLVTRDDMYKTISDINSRLDNIEAPDLAPLAQKVDYLEKKIESIYDMLKSVSSRIPVIVE